MTSTDGRLLAYLSSLQARWLAEQATVQWQQLDATLVFADVSGFTPLSEKLARKGKVGAEELTSILNGLFGELLGVASRYGGDCLKFGGDAVLLLFTDSGNAGRAELAAHEMLDAIRRYRRASGLKSLGMSIGLHSGPALLTLAGSRHRELMAVGPAVSATLQAEHDASSGEIRITLQAQERLADEKRAGVVPLPVETLSPPLCWGVHASAGLPEPLVEFLTGEPQDGEHRMVSVGFVHFSGCDGLLERDGPDALASCLDDLARSAQEAAARHGVTFLASDVDADGGKLIFAAGAPTSSSDDEDRLLHALKEVVQPGPLTLQAGANRGRVFVVDLGASSRRAFTVIGDAVNLAARVMGRAEPGQVLATRQLLERVRTNFQASMVEPFAVKGKSNLIEAGIVQDAVGLLPEDQLDDLPLIGRPDERKVIREAIDGASHGTGSVIEIVGEPGIGKSKMLRSAVAEATLPTFLVRAGRYSQATPYYALRGPLRRLLKFSPDAAAADVATHLQEALDEVAPDLADWRPLVGYLLGAELPETPQTAGLDIDYRAAKIKSIGADLLTRLLPGATLIVVEDAHWLDSPSSDLLAELMTLDGRPPWVFLVSRRPVSEGMQLGDLTTFRLVLEPLSEDDAFELISASLASAGSSLMSTSVRQLVGRSGGNPLFLLELLRATMSHSVEELPDSVEAVISTMIDTLPPDDRLLVRRAAVVGQRFPLSILATALSADQAHLTFRLRSLGHFVKVQGGEVEFGHALLRDVAYETLPYRARRQLHGKAGLAWEEQAGDDAENVAELLSVHFHAAGEHERTWRYSQIAGQKAERAAAPIEAAGFYQRALDAGRFLSDVGPGDEARVCERLGDMAVRSGRYTESRSAYGRARRLNHQPVAVARLHRKSAFTWDQEGRYPDAMRACRRGLDVLDPVPEDSQVLKERSRLLAQHGTVLLRKAQHIAARPQLEEAARLARATASDGGDAALARAFRLLDWLYIELSEDPPEPYGELALDLYQRVGDNIGISQTLNNMGIAAYYRGDWDRSVDLYEKSRDAAARGGSVLSEALVMNNIAEIRSDQGRFDEAEELLREALAIWRTARHGFEGMTLGNLARLAARRGDFEESERLYTETISILESHNEKALLAETHARRAEQDIFSGKPDDALQVLQSLRQMATRVLLPTTAALVERVEGWALVQLGQLDEGFARLSQAGETSRERRDDYGAAAAVDSLARLADERGDAETADRLSGEASELVARLGIVELPRVPFEITSG